MRQFRKAMIAVASAAMLLGTMGIGAASAASSGSTCVSRAQFIYDFDVAAGITPIYPETSDFSDVSSSSPYYGYIEAATKAGFINGTGSGQFSPNGCLTRAQIAKIEVLALGDGSAAASDAASSTTFSDDSQIPTWARGYVVEAVALGLVHGYPDGSFSPNATMTATDEGYFLSQYKTVENAVALTVTASATDVGVGQSVSLTASGTSEPVTFSTTSGAVTSGSTFIGSTPGNYTVTASTTDGLTATVKIAVYGAATGLTINPPSTVVANGVSQYTLTVDVVDANGNTVGGNTDSITLKSDTASGVGVDNNGTAAASGTNVPATAVNGVATFTLDAGQVAGATATLTAGDTLIGSGVTQTGTITTTAQVATSLSVTAPTYVDANAANTAKASAAVEDQTGNPMLSGAYSVSMSLTGPAAFTSDLTTGPETGAFVGNNGAGNPATFPFASVQSETGAITFTASATGLTSGTATTTAVIAGAPAALQLSADPSTGGSFADGNPAKGATFDVQVVDSHGYPVATVGNENLSFSVTDSSGNNATANEGLTEVQVTNTTGTDGAASFSVTDPTSKPNAGTYTVQVSDAGTLGLTASSTQTLTINPGAALSVAVVQPQTGPFPPFALSAQNPTVTLTAQVEDANGNAVPAPGLTLSFNGAPSPYGYTLGDLSTTGAPLTYTGTTDAKGQATATLSVGPYTGQLYGVFVDDVTDPTHLNSVFPAIFQVESTVGTSMTAATYNGGTEQSVFKAGNTITVEATVKDQYGTPVGDDYLNFTYNGQTIPAATVPGTGIATVAFTATTAGTATIQIQDLTSSNNLQTTAVAAVTPGTLAGWAFYTTDGTLVANEVAYTENVAGATGKLTVAANTPVELILKPIDSFGNPIVLAAPQPVALDDTGNNAYGVGIGKNANNGGAFRLTENGTDLVLGSGNDPITAPAGTSQMTVWYVNGTAGTYNLANDAD